MEGKTILVIDTDTETIQNVMSTLESEGYLVFAASSKDVSITMANKVKPSLIFINIGMSGTSGLEICKAIHETETLENVPIVIITPHGGTIDPRYASLYGIVDLLKKTFTSEELISKTNALAMKSIDQPIQEGATVQPVEEEINVHLFEEGGIAEDAEEEFEVQTIEEVSVRPVEEKIEIRKGEYSTTIKETSNIQKEETKEIFSKESDIRQMVEDVEEGEKEQIAIEEPGESDLQMRDNLYKTRKRKVRASRRNRLFVPVLVLVLMVIVLGGIVLYKGMRQEIEIQAPVIVTPTLLPNQKPVTEVEPSREQQKSQKAVDEIKLKPPPVAETKPESKPIYSVQIGVFKNKANALAFMKKYEERGYDTFMYKSITSDRGILYKVLIGNFDNKKEATKLANNIRIKENINVIIFRK